MSIRMDCNYNPFEWTSISLHSLIHTKVEQNHISKTLEHLLIGVIIIAAMIFASTYLIPVSWAFLFACLLYPVCYYLESKGLNRTITSIVVTLGFCVAMFFILYFLITQALAIIKTNDNVVHKIKDGIESTLINIQDKSGFSFYEPHTLKESLSNVFKNGIGVISNQISSVGANIITLALTPVFLFFLLNLRGQIKEFLFKNYKGSDFETAQVFVTKSLTAVKNYLWGTMILTFVTAIMTYIILMLFGIKSAIFFSIFLAVLNIIPYVGNLVAYIGILSFVWITKDSNALVIYVGLSLYFSNMIQENILRPKLVGDKMEINAFLVLSSVMIGAIIWGVSGMVLFVPFLGIAKALVESNPEWEKYAILFASEETDPNIRLKIFTRTIFQKKAKTIQPNETIL
jgi:predicted PurR-regulated permease PerM